MASEVNRTYFSTPLAALALLVLTSPVFAQNRGFDLPAFSAISISSELEAEVRQGEQQTIRVEATDSSNFEHLQLSVEDGKLVAATDYNLLDFLFGGGLLNSIFGNTPAISIFVTLPRLQAIEANSGATVTIGDFSGEILSAIASSGAQITAPGLSYETITLNASSGSEIMAGGTCISLGVKASSGADVKASDLQCETTSANASSGADLSVFASQQVSANASSGADIAIFGNPDQSDVKTSSGGDINFVR